jgi:hypothetical protein
MNPLLLLVSGMVLIAQPAISTSAKEPVPVKIPDELKVPKGNRLLVSMEAEGVQIYVSAQGKGGKLEWRFKAPLAELSDRGKKVGYHFAGPAWETLDGSRVVRDPSEAIASVKAPNPAADIPWLRIKVKADGLQGTSLRHVTYVLRLNTRGGTAPAELPTRVGTEVGVKYKATYQFYRSAGSR